MTRRRQPRRLVTGSVWDRLGLDVAGAGWMRDGLCAQTDPDAFFPAKGVPNQPAKRVCVGCPATGDCLAYALAHNERFGVWGGTSERQRVVLRRRRAVEGRAA